MPLLLRISFFCNSPPPWIRACVQKSPTNAHADASRGARGLKLGLGLYRHTYIVLIRAVKALASLNICVSDWAPKVASSVSFISSDVHNLCVKPLEGVGGGISTYQKISTLHYLCIVHVHVSLGNCSYM